jgi:tetratricopeptide (TPR) repeat protein
MNKSEDYLKSIKSRIGWQVGLQTATLFAIGGVNSSIREECGLIAEDVKKLSDNTIKGLNSVQDAVQSLETSLIYGIEELKWILGSIDDELKIIIGLIQFPKSTESNEKYLMGYELYKSEYYEEAIKQFENAVKLSPLNLNARVGLYLSKLKISENPDIESLIEIAKLTNSDFYLHKEVTQAVRDASFLFFTNFVSSQLCFLNEFSKWIELYSTVIPSIAQNDLSNKVRLIESLINTNEDYSSLLTDLFDEGYLGSVLFGLNYKETKGFAKFIETCFNLSKKRLNIKEIDTEKRKYNLPIIQSIENFFNYISSKEGIFVFGKLNNSIAEKNNITESLYMLNDNIPKYYELLKETERSLSNDVVSIADIQINTIYEESNEYLSDSFKNISDDYKKIITKYKTDETKRIKTEINKTILLAQKFEKGIPELEKYENDLCAVIQKHFSKISYDKKHSLGFKKGLEELLKVSHSFTKNENEVSDSDSIKDKLKDMLSSLDPLATWECSKCKRLFVLGPEEIEELKNEGSIEIECPTCNEMCTCEIDKKAEEEDE